MEFAGTKLTKGIDYAPSVSIALQTPPKHPQSKETAEKIKAYIDKAKRELKEKYPADKVKAVVAKLEGLAAEVNLEELSKGLLLLASPLEARALYLPFPVEDKLSIGETFETRDFLTESRKIITYLFISITYKKVSVYMGINNKLTPIDAEMPSMETDYERVLPDTALHFTDENKEKQIMLHKFLLAIDRNIGKLVQEYQLPVIVGAAVHVLGEFRKLTHHAGNVAAYVDRDYDKLKVSELGKVLQPAFEQILRDRENAAVDKVNAAENAGKCAAGLSSAWNAALEKRGALLVMEEGYKSDAVLINDNLVFNEDTNIQENDDVADPIDRLIEIVLQYDGDVEFVSKGKLDTYQQVALVTRY